MNAEPIRGLIGLCGIEIMSQFLTTAAELKGLIGLCGIEMPRTQADSTSENWINRTVWN